MTVDCAAWAAGLFEGEGSVSTADHSPFGKFVQVYLSMSDEDIVRRFHAVVGIGSVCGPYHNGVAHHKARWTWRCTAWRDAESICLMLWPWLGPRRRSRFEEVVEAAEAAGLGPRRKPWTQKPWADARNEMIAERRAA